jgi:hypothetical protein
MQTPGRGKRRSLYVCDGSGRLGVVRVGRFTALLASADGRPVGGGIQNVTLAPPPPTPPRYFIPESLARENSAFMSQRI